MSAESICRYSNQENCNLFPSCGSTPVAATNPFFEKKLIDVIRGSEPAELSAAIENVRQSIHNEVGFG
jgi:hypothetical protein